MEKHSKDMENIKVEKDFSHIILKEIDVNYQNLKVEKDIMSVEYNKLQRYYKNMEQILLKQQKELDELRMEVGYIY